MPLTVGQNKSFIDLLRAGCDDQRMNRTLERLLSLPDERRHVLLASLVRQLRHTGAPADFIRAVACLADDRVAEKAYEVIYHCEHPAPARRRMRLLGGMATAGSAALVAWALSL